MSPDAIGVGGSMRAWDAINEIACRGYFYKMPSAILEALLKHLKHLKQIHLDAVFLKNSRLAFPSLGFLLSSKWPP
jgi:CO dehydrogenase/acetyl-CoA synthase epsilon subunit